MSVFALSMTRLHTYTQQMISQSPLMADEIGLFGNHFCRNGTANLCFGLSLEAHVEADGTGRAKLARYDEQVKDRVEIEIQTENFGKTWSVVKS